VDHALGDVPPPEWVTRLAGPTRTGWLVLAVGLGLVIQGLHQAVLMTHTLVHTRTGQQLTRDLRQRLFIHFQLLGLRHHARLPVGELAHRLQTDATFLDHLLVRGALPLLFSVTTLVVMFSVLASVDRQLAVVSLAVVPPLFVWL